MNTGDESGKSARGLPVASVEKSRENRWLWLIPLAAASLCAWFAWRDFISTGPLVTIYFQNAEGLQVENTQVTYRGAQVGAVKEIALSPDGKNVEVKARLSGSARRLARTGSLFWIVRPELKVGAISGLRTIVSGEYIAVQPGDGEPTNSFVGEEEQPIAREPNALRIKFLASALGSLQEKSPIFYRGIEVGEVVFYQLADDARQVVIHAHIWAQYAPLVRQNSIFWNAGGLDLRMGLFKGVQISAESPRTLLSGGIEFATPPDVQEAATNGTIFPLNEKAEDKWKAWSPFISLHLAKKAPDVTNGPASPYLK